MYVQNNIILNNKFGAHNISKRHSFSSSVPKEYMHFSKAIDPCIAMHVHMHVCLQLELRTL